MKALAENGIDILNTDKKGANALHVATMRGYENIVKMLITSKYPLDNEMKNGATALGIAVRDPNLMEITSLLVKAGADANHTNS